MAVDEVISSIGRKTIETILTLSAEHAVGAQTPGKISGDILETCRRCPACLIGLMVLIARIGLLPHNSS